jgi:hypothetical protein
MFFGHEKLLDRKVSIGLIWIRDWSTDLVLFGYVPASQGFEIEAKPGIEPLLHYRTQGKLLT